MDWIKGLAMWIGRLKTWIGRPIKALSYSTEFWLVFVAVVLLGSILGLAIEGWDWLRPEPSDRQSDANDVAIESRSTTIRNAGFVIAGAIALVFAVWRGVVAQRQAETAQHQSETLQRQSETSQQGLLNERFQKGTEMLGSEVLTVRLGGIYALQSLAEGHPDQYHVQVMRQLCAFVRHPTEVKGQPTFEQEEYSMTREEILSIDPDRTDLPPIITATRFKPREDIQAAMEAIAFCHDKNQKAETDNSYWLDLHGADLRGVDLSNMNLARSPWTFELVSSFYQLITARRYTDMRETKLDHASLIMTDLSDVDLSGSTGLTQNRFDSATFDPERPPKLDNVLDPYTGEQVVLPERTIDNDSTPDS